MIARLLKVILATLILGTGTVTFAAPTENADKPSTGEGYRLQQFDAPLEKHIPKNPRTATEQDQVDSLAWFMAGRLHESRNNFQAALDSYKKAIELTPNSVDVYRAMVPLAFGLNRIDEAIEYGLKAVELDPSDYGLLRRLGVEMARRSDLPRALQLLEKAANSPKLDKKSGPYVMLMRDLAILYGATGQKEKTADAYEVVFKAVTERDKYKIDARTYRVLTSDATTTYEKMGEAFLEVNRSELAIRAFEKAAETKQGNVAHLSFNLAQVYLQTDQAEKALENLQKYFDAQLQSKGKSAYELLANILKKLNKSDELIGRLEAMSDKDARNATLQYFLAEQYVIADRLDDAESLYTKALESSPDSDGFLGLATIYRKKNQPADLLENMASAFARSGLSEELELQLQAIAEDENLSNELVKLGQQRVKDQDNKIGYPESRVLAELASQAEQADAAEEFFRAALANVPAEGAATLYQDFGRFYMSARRYDKAVELYEKASTIPGLRNQQPIFLYFLSQAHELNGDTDAALAAIAQAKANRPEIALLEFQEAWIYYHAHRWDEALKRFDQVIDKFPQDTDTVRRCRFSISNIHVQRGDIRKGEEILEKVLEEDPDDPSVNNDLGYLYADQGKNLEKAEKMIRKAIAAEPENGAYLDSLGWVLFKLERFKEAVTYLVQASEKEQGQDATIWDHLGDCYHSLDEQKKAVDSWTKALDLAKKDVRPDAKLIERLEQKLKNQSEASKGLKPAKPNSP